jgi:hypothetical protein
LRKTAFVTLTVAGMIASVVSPVHAGWLIYHKPAFEGRIVDADTGGPIEGAIVMAVYHKRILSIPHGGYAEIYVQEAVTDKEGGFRFPSYMTIISPLSTEDYVGFAIYKKGYVSLRRKNLEAAFTKNPPEDGEIGPFGGGKMVIVRPGVVSLPKWDTPEDAREDVMDLSLDIPSNTLLK